MKSAEERRRNSVEAHCRNGRFAARPLHNTREIIQSRAEARKRTTDNKSYNDVAFFSHTAILCGVTVIARRLQFITEFCFVKDYPDYNCNKNSNGNCNRCIVVIEKFTYSERRNNCL